MRGPRSPRISVDALAGASGGGAGGDLTGLTAGTGIDIADATGPVPTISIAALYRTSGSEWFGLGLDGATTINAGGTVTATGNYYPSTMTVSNATNLALANYGIFGSVSVTVESGSVISNDGNAGAAATTAGAATAVGAVGPATSAGGAGGTGAGNNAPVLSNAIGGAGGNAGIGSGGAGGNAGSKTAPTELRGGPQAYSVPAYAMTAQSWFAGASSTAVLGFGVGGGGGGGDGTAGGGGGAGGGVTVVAAPTIANSGAIRAHGGDGGSPAAGNRGGGGGGGGGAVFTMARVYGGVGGTYTATGGTGGTKSGTGTNGSNGSAGVIAQFTP